MTKIVPTIGRVVWFRPEHDKATSDQPFPALVSYVWDDSTINVGGFDQNGRPFSALSVPLLQEDDAIPAGGFYAEWMPYQRGQAAKYDEAVKLADSVQAATEGTGTPEAPAATARPVLDIPDVLGTVLQPVTASTGRAITFTREDGQDPASFLHDAQVIAPGLEAGEVAASTAQRPGTKRVKLGEFEDKLTVISFYNPPWAPHVTVCLLKFENGWISHGLSAPMDATNYDEQLGREFSYQDALKKVWPLEAYARLSAK